jgi:hypothetical protein
MSNEVMPIKKDQPEMPTAENQKSKIENHKTAAMHHGEAAKNHTDAAKHREDGNHDKANDCTVKAQGHSHLANEANKEVIKNHVSTK